MEDLEAVQGETRVATRERKRSRYHARCKRSGQAIRPRPRRRDSEEHRCSGEGWLGTSCARCEEPLMILRLRLVRNDGLYRFFVKSLLKPTLLLERFC